MKILVTGAAGFIGGNFVHYLVEKHPEDKVVALDKLTYAGNMETLEPVINKIKFVKEDICNRKEIFALFKHEKFDIVVYLFVGISLDVLLIYQHGILQQNLQP